MSKPTRSYWTALPRSGDAAAIAEAARRAEARGYRGVVAAQVYGPPWASLAVAAGATSKLQVASGIAMAFVRSPFETACAALDLDRLAGGRFTLGLGTAPQDWTEQYFGMPYGPPVDRLREVIAIVRHVEAAARSAGPSRPAQLSAFEGRHYSLAWDAFEPTFAPRSGPLPIWVAALREKLCELAGESADGLIGHPVWSVDWTLGPALSALTQGAAKAGRHPDDIHLQLWVTVSLDDDPTEAVRQAKGNVAFYGGIPQYQPFFAAHGFGDEARRLGEARQSLPVHECARLVPDEMARTFVVCGDADQVSATLHKLWSRADSMVVRPPAWGIEPARSAELLRRVEDLVLSPADAR